MFLNKNFIPDNVRRVHLIAVCGTGMGALACMLKDLGFEVTGSDQKVYPPMSHFLLQKGIDVINGFNENNISYCPDLVIVGNAVKENNPEVKMMHKMGICFCSMPQAINRFVVGRKKAVIVTGTHGKTTTSSMIAWILYCAGLDPSFIIGGILNNFNSNYRLGKGEYVVIEGDEYDTAFFDKNAKFFHYDPYIATLLNIEFDHADIFEDIKHINKIFKNFVSGISKENTLVAFQNDKNIVDILSDTQCKIIKYGNDSSAAWQLGNISADMSLSLFDILNEKQHYASFKTELIGQHNLLNALCAVAVSDNLKIKKEIVASALKSFKGVKRRQEIRGIKRGAVVMDDFAHHPTAVEETIKGVKLFYPDKRLIAVFEPRTNSSMRKIFQNIYPDSFNMADIICIRKPPLLEKIPYYERFSSRQLVEDLKKRGKKAYYFPETEPIIDFLIQEVISEDIILIMSNGGFDNIHEKLLKSL